MLYIRDSSHSWWVHTTSHPLRMWSPIWHTHSLFGVSPLHTGKGSLKQRSRWCRAALPVVSGWGTGQRSWGIFSTGTVDGNLLNSNLACLIVSDGAKGQNQPSGWTERYIRTRVDQGTEITQTQPSFHTVYHSPGPTYWRRISQIHYSSKNIPCSVTFSPSGWKFSCLGSLNSSFQKLQGLDREMPSWYMSIFHKHPLLAIRHWLHSPS